MWKSASCLKRMVCVVCPLHCVLALRCLHAVLLVHNDTIWRLSMNKRMWKIVLVISTFYSDWKNSALFENMANCLCDLLKIVLSVAEMYFLRSFEYAFWQTFAVNVLEISEIIFAGDYWLSRLRENCWCIVDCRTGLGSSLLCCLVWRSDTDGWLQPSFCWQGCVCRPLSGLLTAICTIMQLFQ